MPKNMRRCSHCGSIRVYPEEPGDWEYRHVYMGENSPWYKCKVVVDEREEPPFNLLFIPEEQHKPTWWPNDCEWRKAGE